MLAAGNARFMADERAHPHQDVHFRHRIAAKQNPFAIFFGCADSRVAAEIIFDQGLGDLFVVRTAGHVIDPSVLGSLEFGVGVLDCPLIVVLGHDSCGAVRAAEVAVRTGEVPGGFLRDIVERVTPSVLAASRGGRTPTIEQIEREHVERTCDLISERSTLIADRIRSGALGVVGAEYDLADGEAKVVAHDRRRRSRPPRRVIRLDGLAPAPGQEHRGASACCTATSSRGGCAATAAGWSSTRTGSASPPARSTDCSPSPPTPPATDPALAAALRLSAPGREPLDVERCPPAQPSRSRVHGRGLQGVAAPDEAGAWFARRPGPRRPAARPRALAPTAEPHPRPTGGGHRLRRRLPGHPRLRRLAAPAARVGRRDRARAGRGAARTARRGAVPPQPRRRRRPRARSRRTAGAGCASGPVEFRVVKPVDRCVLTTIDPTHPRARARADPHPREAPEVGRGHVVRGAARARVPGVVRVGDEVDARPVA